MATNKVIVNNQTLIDLTEDTVTPSSLLRGATAHNAAGAVITGAYTAPYNVNLLHNADWGYSLVNQRNHSGAANSEYCIDRWIGNGTVTPSAGSYITLAAGTTMEQRMEIISDALFGKAVTFSYEDSTGNVYSDTIVFPTASGQGIDARIGALYVEIGFISTSAINICGVSRTDIPWIYIRANSAVNVRRVWLELGEVSHMENTPPLDYATNLAICMRYYISTPLLNTLCTWTTSTQARALFVFPVPMRTTPSSNITTYNVLYNNAWNDVKTGCSTSGTTTHELIVTSASGSLPGTLGYSTFAQLRCSCSADL